MERKNIIIISFIVLGIVLLSALTWFLFFRGGEEGAPRGGILGGLFPGGQEGTLDLGEQGGIKPPIEGEGAEQPARGAYFVQLANIPVSNGTFIPQQSTSSPVLVRYVERATGHIYQIEDAGQNRSRISNTTILKTFDSLWSPSANNLVISYTETSDKGVDSLKLFSATISTTTSSIAGVFLPPTASGLAVSPAENKIFYVTPSSGDYHSGLIADFDNKNQKQIYSGSFGDYRPNWINKNIISLLTKPSARVTGFFYFLDSSTGSLIRILGGKNGLAALASPDGSKVVYSQSGGRSISSFVLDVAKRETSALDQQTFADKCVWAKTNSAVVYCAVPKSIPSKILPDEWYQGFVSFNDAVWRIDTTTGVSEKIIDSDFDMIDLKINALDSSVLFVNKKDLGLWVLKFSAQ